MGLTLFSPQQTLKPDQVPGTIYPRFYGSQDHDKLDRASTLKPMLLADKSQDDQSFKEGDLVIAGLCCNYKPGVVKVHWGGEWYEVNVKNTTFAAQDGTTFVKVYLFGKGDKGGVIKEPGLFIMLGVLADGSEWLFCALADEVLVCWKCISERFREMDGGERFPSAFEAWKQEHKKTEVSLDWCQEFDSCECRRTLQRIFENRTK
ncbi:hypothetical protein BGZ63DRAFT_462086 [Mariannaea sp. PMI_226]|nr:hypothetical protein BGZ63DRAFT_462086 [Mariannaea sp. PMI_226]